MTGDFVIRYCKQGAPNYSRNIQIMERLSGEELPGSVPSAFWTVCLPEKRDGISVRQQRAEPLL